MDVFNFDVGVKADPAPSTAFMQTVSVDTWVSMINSWVVGEPIAKFDTDKKILTVNVVRAEYWSLSATFDISESYGRLDYARPLHGSNHPFKDLSKWSREVVKRLNEMDYGVVGL